MDHFRQPSFANLLSAFGTLLQQRATKARGRWSQGKGEPFEIRSMFKWKHQVGASFDC